MPSPKKTASKKLKQPRLAIIAADFNKGIVAPMVEQAKKTAHALGCSADVVVSVPGAFEIPLVLDTVLQRRDIDIAVVLGYIEKGQTLHGEVMGNAVSKAIIDLQLKRATCRTAKRRLRPRCGRWCVSKKRLGEPSVSLRRTQADRRRFQCRVRRCHGEFVEP